MPLDFALGEAAQIGEEEGWEAYKGLIAPIRFAWRTSGVSLRALATEAGLAGSAVSNMLSLKTWPRLSTVQRVASAVGYQLVYDENADVLGQLVAELEELRGGDRDDLGNLFWLAQHSGLQPNTLYDLMLGRTDPRISTVLALLVGWGRADALQLRYAP